MVDWLIGDGPDNSVSQICQKCGQFNGTIPKEEALFNGLFDTTFLHLPSYDLTLIARIYLLLLPPPKQKM